MRPTPTKKELETIKRFPWQWAVILLSGAVGFVFGLYNMRVSKSDETCQDRINRYTIAIARRDSAVFYWQTKYIFLSNELLYKNHIIDRQQTVINKTDSVARTKLEKPAKQIVKSHDQPN